jgi:hypothetical protein
VSLFRSRTIFDTAAAPLASLASRLCSDANTSICTKCNRRLGDRSTRSRSDGFAFATPVERLRPWTFRNRSGTSFHAKLAIVPQGSRLQFEGLQQASEHQHVSNADTPRQVAPRVALIVGV